MLRAWRQDKLAFCLVGIRKNDGIFMLTNVLGDERYAIALGVTPSSKLASQPDVT
ncbi:Uncharacterised protein [Serratia fonticola]|nr:hypothetical protein L581_2027 [Serratia fonticola AU-AP2C]RDL25174.1 hypothetical protein DFO62_106107 [Serratia fonticola]CAI0817839.1 Uncharacterised protein [Serratia fonticola]